MSESVAIKKTVTCVRSGLLRRMLSGTLSLVLWFYFLFALLVLVLRYAVFPHVNDYRDWVEGRVFEATGLPVRIGEISADWQGLRPELTLDRVQLLDSHGREALHLPQVHAVFSWRSILFRQPVLHLLSLERPMLHIQRLTESRWVIAGVPVSLDHDGDSRVADWILQQDRLVVRQGEIEWRDDVRAAPPLRLEALDFRMDNRGRQHRFGLQARPSGLMARHLDLRGEIERGDERGDERGEGQASESWSRWGGRVFVSLKEADVQAVRPWVDLPPEVEKGRGSIALWGHLSSGSLEAGALHDKDSSSRPSGLNRQIHADMDLQDVRVSRGGAWLSGGKPDNASPVKSTIELSRLRGSISVDYRVGLEQQPVLRVQIGNLEAHLASGEHVGPWSASAHWSHQAGVRGRGELQIKSLDLAQLAAFAERLPLPESMHSVLSSRAPRGRFDQLEMSWDMVKSPSEEEGNASASPSYLRPVIEGWDIGNYSLQGRFDGLSIQSTGLQPGVKNLTGNIRMDPRQGTLNIDSRSLALDLPGLFPDAVIPADYVKGRLAWTVDTDHWTLALNDVKFQNADARGEAKGTYVQHRGQSGEIDLVADLFNAQGVATWKYLPASISSSVRQWVRTSVKAGVSPHTRLELRGPLVKFPFKQPGEGKFLVDVQMRDAELDYADGWPRIRKIDGVLRFEAEKMHLLANDGEIHGARLRQVNVLIPDLEVMDELLHIQGRVEGSTARFLDFIEKSPVAGMIDHATSSMRASGQGVLHLGLALPIRRLHDTGVSGEYQLVNNSVSFSSELPGLTNVNARVGFTDRGVMVSTISGAMFGKPLKMTTRREAGASVIQAEGKAGMDDLRRIWGNLPGIDKLSGSLAWSGEVRLGAKDTRVQIASDLVGIDSPLPAPLNKSAATVRGLGVEYVHSRSGGGESLRLALKGGKDAVPLDGYWLWREENGSKRLLQGYLNVGLANARPAEKGFSVAVYAPVLNADELLAQTGSPGGSPAGSLGGSNIRNLQGGDTKNNAALALWGMPPASVMLRTDQLIFQGRRFSELDLRLSREGSAYRGLIAAKEMAGEVSWNSEGKGRVRARLERLSLAEDATGKDTGGVRRESRESRESEEDLPAIDLHVRNFSYGERSLGELTVQAENAQGVWRLNRVRLANPDGNLEARGQWRQAGGGQTDLAFEIQSANTGALLDRLGYANLVKRGESALEGRLSWRGSPVGLDYPSMSGRLKLRSQKGQFAKIEPGLGKLIGLLSLQSLPKRITLDFRDVFSDGFAFDNLEGELNVSQGVLRTEQILIEGTSAKVVISGSADLERETQHLRVNVQPELSSTVAIGAAVINPVAGLTTLLAQKILKDPFSRLFSFEYDITGTWKDPVVQKVGQTERKNDVQP